VNTVKIDRSVEVLEKKCWGSLRKGLGHIETGQHIGKDQISIPTFSYDERPLTPFPCIDAVQNITLNP
jgi:hypothetical protein